MPKQDKTKSEFPSDDELYGEDFFHIFIYGSFEPNMSISISEKINAMNNEKKFSRKGIVLHINSVGGCVSSAFGIVNTIRSSKLPVISIVEGKCMSAATFLFVMCNYRIMAKFSQFLIHDLSTCGLGCNTHREKKFSTEMDDNIMAMIREVYKLKTNIKEEHLNTLIHTEIFLTPSDCIKHGIADHILTSSKVKLKNVPKFLHIYKYDNVYTYPRNGMSIGDSAINIVFDILKSPRDSLIRFNSFTDSYQKYRELINIIPVINYVINVKKHIYALIDGYHSPIELLLFLVSDARYIYSATSIRLDFVNLMVLGPAKALNDVMVNSSICRDYVNTILDTYTKLPKEIKKNIFDNEYLINSNDALKYGLVDVVLN